VQFGATLISQRENATRKITPYYTGPFDSQQCRLPPPTLEDIQFAIFLLFPGLGCQFGELDAKPNVSSRVMKVSRVSVDSPPVIENGKRRRARCQTILRPGGRKERKRERERTNCARLFPLLTVEIALGFSISALRILPHDGPTRE